MPLVKDSSPVPDTAIITISLGITMVAGTSNGKTLPGYQQSPIQEVYQMLPLPRTTEEAYSLDVSTPLGYEQTLTPFKGTPLPSSSTIGKV
jgi:hypothetical protein